MKKQFFRVKQLADQTFLRADRSECLNQDELKKADWKVEYITKVFSEVIKKLPAPVPQTEAFEKRKKKYYEFNLGNAMSELANCEEVERRELLLKEILRECGDAEMHLSEDQLAYETQVEQYVSVPINNILEKELPNIIKQKKNLNKYILDKDSATSRYHNALKNGTQKENLKEEMDEADIKVDQSRDVLAVEMFGLLRKEHEMCIYVLQLLKLQRSYHESALKTLTSVIPTLEQRISESHIKPVFGCNLIDHLKINKRTIAFPIELCVVALMEFGMSEEGLFRVVGGASKVKRLKLSIDSGCFTLPLIPEYKDVHVLASTLKSYLRELPEPLLTHTLYGEWMNSMRHPEEERLKVIMSIIKRMPQQHRDNLGYLIQFLSNLTKQHSENKMNTSNIAIVMSPNLLWAKDEEINMHMKNCATVNMIVEFLLNNVNSLFPDDLLANVSIKKAELIGPEKPDTHSTKLGSIHFDQHDYHSEMSSPKPTLRRKVKAPAPPSTIRNEEFYQDNNIQDGCPTSYNTLPLARSNKLRASDIPRPKQKSESNSEEETSNRRCSLVVDEKNTHNQVELPNSFLVNSESTKSFEHKYTNTQHIHVTKSKPAQQVTPQTSSVDVAAVNSELQKTGIECPKPVAAPRTSILESDKLVRRDSMSKSLNSIDSEDGVQIRRSSRDELLDKPSKPAIPVRPASLRTPLPRTLIDADPAVHKTQCSVYNTPHKQQPSIVTLPKTFAAGHDNQIAEKEKFLGHQPTPKIAVENIYSDINSNCDNKHPVTKPDIPSKPPLMKSNEKLNDEPMEKINGNKTSHIRTRSDGNIVGVHPDGIHLLQTPPSPRSLNKPSQPPPPPPVVNKPKSEPETTNF